MVQEAYHQPEILQLYNRILGIDVTDNQLQLGDLMGKFRINILNEKPTERGFWKTSGYLDVSIVNGQIILNVNVPSGSETEDDRQTYAHEITHLLHFILNETFQELQIKRIALVEKLNDFPLGKYNLVFLSIESGLPDDIAVGLKSLANIFDIEFEIPNSKTALINFIQDNTRASCTHTTILRVTQTLIELGIFPDDKLILFNQAKRKHGIWLSHMKNQPNGVSTLSDEQFDLFYAEEARLRKTVEMKLLRDTLEQVFSGFTDDQANQALRNLVLEGLPEVIAINNLEQAINATDFDVLRDGILEVVSSSEVSDKKIDSIYYELRPIGYENVRENREWLSITDLKEKIRRIIEKLPDINNKSYIIQIAKLLVEEDIDALVGEYDLLAVTTGSNIFWDFDANDPLLNNTRYMQEFLRSVTMAMQNGSLADMNIPSPNMLTNSTDGALNIQSGILYQNILNGYTDTTMERMFSVLGQQRFVAKFRSARPSANELQKKLESLIKAVDNFYIKGYKPSTARTELLKSMQVENLVQAITEIDMTLNMLIEPVAFAIGSMVSRKLYDFTEPAHLGYGVAFTSKDHNGNPVINSWIQAIVNFLKEDTSKRLIQFLRCKTIEEQKRLVQFEA